MAALLLAIAATACSSLRPKQRTVNIIDAEDGSPIADALIEVTVSYGYGFVHQLELNFISYTSIT